MIFYKVPAPVFQSIKMMGIGVLLGFAWIHLFSFGDMQLRSPCLPTVFSGKYNSWASLFAIIALSTTQFIQFLYEILIRKIVMRSSDVKSADKVEKEASGTTSSINVVAEKESNSIETKEKSVNVATLSPSDVEAQTQDDEKFAEMRVTVYVNILAIAIHSFVIGNTFGFARNPEFQVFIAPMILYHFFEGFLLVISIEEAQFSSSKFKWLVAMSCKRVYFT